MFMTDPKIYVAGWLAKEDPKLLAETDRTTFFIYFYELLAKSTGRVNNFAGFTLEPLLSQPQLLQFRDEYRADPAAFTREAKAKLAQDPKKVDDSLATMAYVLIKNHSLEFLQDFVRQFDFWKTWQKNQQPSQMWTLTQHDQDLLETHFDDLHEQK